jgi:hypothetical protein
LAPDEAFQLQLQALSVASLCSAALVGSRTAPDRAISIKEAAELLGVSVSTLRHGIHTTYKALVVDNGTRLTMFSSAAIRRFLAR